MDSADQIDSNWFSHHYYSSKAVLDALKFIDIATWIAHYLSSVLTPHQPQQSLRSVNQNLLSVPRCNSSFGQRSFSCCAPNIWNEIPLLVIQSPSLVSFKRNLKTHYSANNWPPGDCIQRLWFDILDTVHSTNCYEWMHEWQRNTLFILNLLEGPTSCRLSGQRIFLLFSNQSISHLTDWRIAARERDTAVSDDQ